MKRARLANERLIRHISHQKLSMNKVNPRVKFKSMIARLHVNAESIKHDCVISRVDERVREQRHRSRGSGRRLNKARRAARLVFSRPPWARRRRFESQGRDGQGGVGHRSRSYSVALLS